MYVCLCDYNLYLTVGQFDRLTGLTETVSGADKAVYPTAAAARITAIWSNLWSHINYSARRGATLQHVHSVGIGTPIIINNNNNNKCVSKTDTNPPFAFQIAFPRGTDFAGFLQGVSKSRDLQSEISVRIKSRIERRIVVYSFSGKFFLLPYRTDVRIRAKYCAIATRLLLCML